MNAARRECLGCCQGREDAGNIVVVAGAGFNVQGFRPALLDAVPREPFAER